MSDCKYCKKSLGAGANNGSSHNMCRDLALERNQRGLCMRCGQNQTLLPECKRCENADDVPYMDYPGPQ